MTEKHLLAVAVGFLGVWCVCAWVLIFYHRGAMPWEFFPWAVLASLCAWRGWKVIK